MAGAAVPLPEGAPVEVAADGDDGAEGVAPPAIEPQIPFPPGPLESVEIHPSSLRLAPGAARRLRARALDPRSRAARGPITYHWQLAGEAAALDETVDGEPAVVVRAGDAQGKATLRVVAHALDGREATAEAAVEVVEEGGRGHSEEGIPEPELVEQPGGAWRSRVRDGRWQVNAAHPEFRAIRHSPALKLRYLSMLFAKEVVLRSTQDPRLDQPLEQLVEIAAYADRNLAGRGRR
jgi:hypothetical protein